GALEGLHRAALGRQPATGAQPGAPGAREGNLLHRRLPRRGVGPGEALELRGAAHPLSRHPPRSPADSLPRAPGDRAGPGALRHRRGGTTPPGGTRRARPRRTLPPRTPGRPARNGPSPRPRDRRKMDPRMGPPGRAPDRVRGVLERPETSSRVGSESVASGDAGDLYAAAGEAGAAKRGVPGF